MAELAACQDVVWHEITLMRPGRYRGSDLGTPPQPPSPQLTANAPCAQ